MDLTTNCCSYFCYYHHLYRCDIQYNSKYVSSGSTVLRSRCLSLWWVFLLREDHASLPELQLSSVPGPRHPEAAADRTRHQLGRLFSRQRSNRTMTPLVPLGAVLFFEVVLYKYQATVGISSIEDWYCCHVFVVMMLLLLLQGNCGIRLTMSSLQQFNYT